MSIARTLLFCLLGAALLVAACSNAPVEPSEKAVAGRVILWHSLQGAEEKALASAIRRFHAVHPDTGVLVRAYPSDSVLVEEYTRAAQSGLGADLLLLDSRATPALTASGWLRPLDPAQLTGLEEQYLATAMTTLRHQGQIFGLPAALNTQALYYNTTLVQQPATTLEQLLADARAGLGLAMGSSFVDAFWGFRVFGAEFVDPDSGEVSVAPGGFVNWLSWLQSARAIPTVWIDDDLDELRTLFLDGKVAYYVGRADELLPITEALGSRAAVAPLPSGIGGSAGPFLTTRALAINANAAPRQAAIAFELARFLTNAEQQAAFVREAQWVPANLSTRISPGLYPNVSAFEAQARTAVPWVGDPDLVAVINVLDETFRRVLAGLARPVDAAALLADQHELFRSLGAAPMPERCTASGTLRVDAVDTGQARQVLHLLADGFARECPNVRVEIELLPAAKAGELWGGTAPGIRGDLVYGTQIDLDFLVEHGLAAEVGTHIDRTLQQSLRPAALESLRHQGDLLGLPINLVVEALYFNRGLVRNPPITLDDLRTQGSDGTPIALDGDFLRSFWGVGAYGGQLYDQSGGFALAPEPLSAWLSWLVASRAEYAIEVIGEPSALRDQFAAGASAYYLGLPDEADGLRARLGEQLGISIVPEGPQQPGTPVGWVGALVANAATTPEEQALSMRFMAYAAGVEAQTLLMRNLGILPANAGVNVQDEPLVATFLSQAQDAQLLSGQPGLATVVTLGNKAFDQVLLQGVEPEVATAAMFDDLARLGIGSGAPVPASQTTGE